ncbi:MAG: cytochrome d ubiquinol oxidase subunit II [Acidimicrobiales bacterium]
MNEVDIVAGAMFLGVIAYAVFGGADFGSGIWDLAAGDAKRGSSVRRLVDHALGPVWEANHVWLIFILVFLFTGFPHPFAAIIRTLAIPLWFAALGIVLRGAGFAFRKYSENLRQARAYGVIFASSSLITPFFLGAIAGAVASGRVVDDGRYVLWSSWLSPTSMVGGTLAVLTCAFLAAVFLAADAEGLGWADTAAWFRHRALVSGAATGFVALAAVFALETDAPTLFDGLTGRALPLVILSAVSGAAAMWLLWANRLRVARIAGVAAVGSVVMGWGVAQYPWILVDHTTLDDGAGAPATLTGLVVGFGLATVLVLPPLAYLYWLADRNDVGSE